MATGIARAALALALSAGALLARPCAAADAPLDLAALRGKVVYVDFWASWCVPCRDSFPWLDGLQREFGPDGLVVVGVNVDHERADAERFLARYAPSFRIGYDPEGALAQRFQVRGMPSSYLIDREGHVRATHAGFRDKDRDARRDEIRRLLAAH